MTRLFLSLSVVAVVAISGARPVLAKVVGPPDKAWKDLTFAEKKAFMKTKVTPTMKPLFQEFDAKKFKTFNCASCHGKDGGHRKLRVPSTPLRAAPRPRRLAGAEEEPTGRVGRVHAKKVQPPGQALLTSPLFRSRRARPLAGENCPRSKPRDLRRCDG